MSDAGQPSLELRRSALAAARETRSLLAELIEHDVDALASELSRVVASLYGAEVKDDRGLFDALSSAMDSLRAARERAGAQSSTAIGRSMALLFAPRKELEVALGLASRDEPTAPFLLEPKRVKPSLEGDERRDAERGRVETYVGLEGESTFFTGRTGDVSSGGLFVATEEPLPVGTELVLSFLLPDGYRVRAAARVTWVRAPRYRPGELPAGMGLRFEELSPKDRHAIEHYLREHPPITLGD
ncbi:MAG: TIGR02266 family protein [Sandaracinaceae bacterium]|nr:TIGR02266 family protein [Sandaracinaceae bacterium]